MYMIEIILLNQSKLSLLGVIRQIPLHAQFRVALFDNFNDISTFTTTQTFQHSLRWNPVYTMTFWARHWSAWNGAALFRHGTANKGTETDVFVSAGNG